MLCQRKLTNLIYTVLEPFVLTEESCSVIAFSLSAFKSKSCYKGLISRSERSIWWYIIYITKGIYFCFYCGRNWYLYILQDVCFCFTRKAFYCCYSYNSVKVLESPGTLSKILEKSWNFDAKSLEKVKKKSWKVQKFEYENMDFVFHRRLS